MKKNTLSMAEWAIFFLLVGILFCVIPTQGCTPTGEWTKHDSVYNDWDHAWFSIIGYKWPYPQQIKKSAFKTWWGDPVKVIELKRKK